MLMEWDNKRYYSLNYFLRQKFGEKIFKISLDGGFTCPNRDGRVSKNGCIFCSPRGSGDFTMKNKDLSLQFEEAKAMMRKKWKSGKYIGYFQAYTNTYAPVEVLREKYNTILEKENVIGLAIATRPDCLPTDILELLEELNSRTYLWVELGLQTIHEDTAGLINRGYALETYISAVEELKKRNIDVVTHCILGLPGETKTDILKTIDYVAKTNTQGIKLHLLHLMKDTPMVRLYEEGRLKFMDKERYVDLVVDCIEKLPPDMVIHRLTGDGPRATLIEPRWSLNKWEVLNAIDEKLVERDSWQGKKSGL
ncbi:TIGR01212 family radical SAM protein [Lutispora sp.]|uniref:TIGR01212 family radical SAM protein n=1 Tax=Lutispora sp. TaxID=2828727 RepID=UPI000ECC4BC8|nr:TIGR01212 family radical SAM protein [Lutispora sp.]MEA4962417.1 TIGR01212 family radical SAM protein [Lutispora sp.]HCJ56734.1 TIGR01212 family radical SAM protein [Clostridiaceae bacterium]